MVDCDHTGSEEIGLNVIVGSTGEAARVVGSCAIGPDAIRSRVHVLHGGGVAGVRVLGPGCADLPGVSAQ